MQVKGQGPHHHKSRQTSGLAKLFSALTQQICRPPLNPYHVRGNQHHLLLSRLCFKRGGSWETTGAPRFTALRQTRWGKRAPTFPKRPSKTESRNLGEVSCKADTSSPSVHKRQLGSPNYRATCPNTTYATPSLLPKSVLAPAFWEQKYIHGVVTERNNRERRMWTQRHTLSTLGRQVMLSTAFTNLNANIGTKNRNDFGLRWRSPDNRLANRSMSHEHHMRLSESVGDARVVSQAHHEQQVEHPGPAGPTRNGEMPTNPHRCADGIDSRWGGRWQVLPRPSPVHGAAKLTHGPEAG